MADSRKGAASGQWQGRRERARGDRPPREEVGESLCRFGAAGPFGGSGVVGIPRDINRLSYA